jgi:hypothetical protein
MKTILSAALVLGICSLGFKGAVGQFLPRLDDVLTASIIDLNARTNSGRFLT